MKVRNVDVPTDQKLVNLKYSRLVTGVFTFKPASQFEERHHSVVSYALNMEDPISKNVCKLRK
jgi:hypothetical protein